MVVEPSPSAWCGSSEKSDGVVALGSVRGARDSQLKQKARRVEWSAAAPWQWHADDGSLAEVQGSTWLKGAGGPVSRSC